MTHELKLRSQYFDLIKNGKKIYEIRLNDAKRQAIKIGDEIIFRKEPQLSETLNCVVNDLIYFDSFENMAKTLSSNEIGFANKSIQEIIDTYHQFYSIENEKLFGVVAIKLSQVTKQ